MKVYVVLVDHRDGSETTVFGVYKQYRHAYQAEQQVLNLGKGTFVDDFKVRIVDEEVVE